LACEALKQRPRRPNSRLAPPQRQADERRGSCRAGATNNAKLTSAGAQAALVASLRELALRGECFIAAQGEARRGEAATTA
jgi:hypothetical protein